MVSFWPFGRSDDNSPDSFERILSKLASQIRHQSSKLASLRQRSRRYKALWTIYTAFFYTIYVVVMVLVVGWKDLGPKELGAVVGGPLGIFAIRSLLEFYFDRRISNTESTLQELQSQQRDTIEKLKAATKFSTTQSIIEKYGGGSYVVPEKKKQAQKIQQQQQPITPNQQFRQRPQGSPTTPQQIQQQLIQQQMMQQQQLNGIDPSSVPSQPQPKPQRPPPNPTPGRPLSILGPMQAHNQPSSQQHIQPEEASSPKWYDRLLDVLVGEDETSAKNRFALICVNCRMVNGLAPPGTRSLDDMDGWGCARCGTYNGGPKKKDQDVVVKTEESASESEPEIKKPVRPRKVKAEENTRTTRSKARKAESAYVKKEEESAEEQHQVMQEGEQDSEEELESGQSHDSEKLPQKKTRGRPRKKA